MDKNHFVSCKSLSLLIKCCFVTHDKARKEILTEVKIYFVKIGSSFPQKKTCFF